MAKNAEADQFAELLVEYQSRLFGYIYALVQNLADTEDLFQQTSAVLWRNFGKFKPETSFLAWARETARLEVLHFVRSRRRSRVQFDEDLISALAESQAQLESREAPHEVYQQALANCMGRLSRNDHQLVTVCYAEECRIQDVAAGQGRSSQSVCNSLKRIRQVLLRCIQRSMAQQSKVLGRIDV
jgi:RNA polymerase sigma-70 factor (ECF subfamily)